MKKLLIILAMMFIGCSESGNSVASFDFEQPGVENDSTEIVIDTTIDTNDSVKDTIIDNNEDTVVVSSSSKVDKSSSSINNNKEESSSSMENKNESSSSENDIVSSSSSSENDIVSSSSSSENVIVSSSSSSELIVSSSSENKVESSSSSKIAESSSSEEFVNSSSSKNEVVNSSSSVDEDYVDENEPKRELLSFVELDELKLNEFRVENSIAYLSWENNTDYTMQINVTFVLDCGLDYVDSTIMYTIKANSVKEKTIYEIKNDDKKCVGHVKTITATENDKSNFYGWKMGSDLGIENIIFEN